MKQVVLPLFLLVSSFAIGAAAQPLQQQKVSATPSQTQPPVDMNQAKGYQVGPGDELTIKVAGETDFDFIARVNEDGKIDVPFDDQPLDARCKTERQLRGEMKQLLSRYLKNPQFSLRVTDQNSRPPATVYG